MKKSVVVPAVFAVTLVLFLFSCAYAELAINLSAIKTIESDGNPLAFNSRTRCYGLYQISEICLRDFNEMNHAQYAPADLFDPLLNEKIASWYFKRLHQLLNAYKIPVSFTTLLAAYNWGIGNVAQWYKNGAASEDLPKATQRYIAKYESLSRGRF